MQHGIQTAMNRKRNTAKYVNVENTAVAIIIWKSDDIVLNNT